MMLEQRHTAFSKAEEIIVENDSIRRVRNGKEIASIRFADIRGVQLVAEGHSQAHKKEVFRCLINANGKTKKMWFSNAIFHGKEHHKMDLAYRQAVQALHKKLEPFQRQVKFQQGSNTYYYCGWFCLFAGILGLLALIIALFTETGRSNILMGKGWMLAMMPVMIASFAIPTIKRGKARAFEPSALPGAFLPHIS